MKTPLYVSLFYILDFPLYVEALYSILFLDDEEKAKDWIQDPSTFTAFHSYVHFHKEETFIDERAINYEDWVHHVVSNTEVVTRIKTWIRESMTLEL